MLDSPLSNVQAYVAHFSAKELPVLRRSVIELAALREQGAHADVRSISALVLADPLLTMRLLTHVENNRGASRSQDITTVERAVMMVGVEPFLEIFSELQTLEDVLHDHPRALVGALRLITRARRAAEIAGEFAVLRRDINAQEIRVAALLYEAAEIVCWVYAPTLTANVYELQKADRSLRTVVAQRRVFLVSAAEIQQSLVRVWGLPQLLVRLLDETHHLDPRVRTVELAVRIARHSSRGWDDAGLPDDFADAQNLLRVGRELLLNRLQVPERFRPALRDPRRPPP